MCGIVDDIINPLLECNAAVRANQITDDNKIQVTVGDNRKPKNVTLDNSVSQKEEFSGDIKVIIDAQIKYNEEAQNNPDLMTEGVGYDIAVLTSALPLFSDADIRVGPICLAALNAAIDKERTITTVGWGRRYDEYPRPADGIRDPTYTTCATNKYGPKFDRFKHCSVRFLKSNQWKCKKINDFPPKKQIYPMRKMENSPMIMLSAKDTLTKQKN